MKVYIVGGESYWDYANWVPEAEYCKDMESADLVLFAGGEDISPGIYGDIKGNNTSCNLRRDREELEDYYKALHLEKPLLGICRGAQLLCALAGGRLVQDLIHPGRHYLTTSEGNKIMVNSLHHQNQFPFEMDKEEYKILAWAENESPFHRAGDGGEMGHGDCEVDICFYPKINALGIQLHPELLHPVKDKETLDYLRGLLKSELNL